MRIQSGNLVQQGIAYLKDEPDVACVVIDIALGNTDPEGDGLQDHGFYLLNYLTEIDDKPSTAIILSREEELLDIQKDDAVDQYLQDNAIDSPRVV